MTFTENVFYVTVFLDPKAMTNAVLCHILVIYDTVLTKCFEVFHRFLEHLVEGICQVVEWLVNILHLFLQIMDECDL